MHLIPSDFLTLFIQNEDIDARYPWRYIDFGQYELKQLLYYSDSSWRMFKIIFHFDKGFNFTSQRCSGQSTGQESDIVEITRQEFDKLFTVKNGTTDYESYQPNDPIILEWLRERLIITSVDTKTHLLIKKPLDSLWDSWGRTEYEAQDNEYKLASYHNFFNYMKPIDRNILLSEFLQEHDWMKEEVPESTSQIIVPNQNKEIEWRPTGKNVIFGSSFKFEINSIPFLCTPHFDFKEDPKFIISYVIRTDVKPWKQYMIHNRQSLVILKKMLDNNVVRRAVSFSKRSWSKRSGEKSKYIFLSEAQLLELTRNTCIKNLSIKRW